MKFPLFDQPEKCLTQNVEKWQLPGILAEGSYRVDGSFNQCAPFSKKRLQCELNWQTSG
jgi:hypothetical protein